MGDAAPKVIYTIMPDSTGIYGWMKRKGTKGIGENMAHDPGWDGDHPISDGLHEAFAAWQDRSERAELSDNGMIVKFDWEAFHREGLELSRRLKKELGDNARVIYESRREIPRTSLRSGGRCCQAVDCSFSKHVADPIGSRWGDRFLMRRRGLSRELSKHYRKRHPK